MLRRSIRRPARVTVPASPRAMRRRRAPASGPSTTQAARAGGPRGAARRAGQGRLQAGGDPEAGAVDRYGVLEPAAPPRVPGRDDEVAPAGEEREAVEVRVRVAEVAGRARLAGADSLRAAVARQRPAGE